MPIALCRQHQGLRERVPTARGSTAPHSSATSRFPGAFHTISAVSMRITLAVAVGALLQTVSYARLMCLTPEMSGKQKDVHMRLAEVEKIQNKKFTAAQSTTVIDTYVHVVSASTNISDGYLSNQTVLTQMDVLNQFYKDTGFVYKLIEVDWTVNKSWAFNDDDLVMKRKLRKGNFRTLNLYYITDIGQGNTGYSRYPVEIDAHNDDFYRDGCVMSSWTAPGGIPPYGPLIYTTGRIAVHEVGHWNNLVHTFDGNNCTGPGDYVDDTPAEESAAYGCQVGRDSCPKEPGLDPIRNHMDYSDETEFTPGQIARMQNSYDYYRRHAKF